MFSNVPKILVVDDEEVIVNAMKSYFELSDFSVSTATTPGEALKIFSKKKFELVFLDIMMPEMTGLELFKKMTRIDPNVPAIIITAHASLETAIEAAKHPGIISYETKPSDLNRLAKLAHEFIARRRAETALRESEERYESIFLDSKSVMILVDPVTGMIEDANPAALDFYGYSYEQMTAKKISDINTLKKSEIFSEMNSVQDGSKRYFNFRHRTASKGIRDVEVYSSPISFKGRILLFSVIHDVTKKQQAEAALRESEEIHRITLSSISDAVFITDDKGNFTYICPNVDISLGYSHDDVAGMGNIYKLLGQDFFSLEQLQKGMELTNIELSVHDKSGDLRHLLVNVKKVDIKGGTILFTCHDVTARRTAEEALRESEAKARALLNAPMDDLILLMDKDHSILDLNTAMANRLREVRPGETQESLVGKDLFKILETSDMTVGKREKYVDIVLKSGRPAHFEDERKGAFFDNIFYPVKDTDGKTRRIAIFARDISARKKMEDEIRKTSEQLKALSHMVISSQEQERARLSRDLHDNMGKQLTALSLEIEWLKHQPGSDPKQLEKLREHLENASSELRLLCRGLRPMVLDDMGLKPALEALTFEFKALAGFHVETDIEDVPRTVISADTAICIYRIGQEALNNAVKHSGAQSVKIILKTMDDYIKFEISDDGNGLPPDFSTSEGLGIIGMRERASLCGGNLRVSARDEGGTVVTMTAPLSNRTEEVE